MAYSWQKLADNWSSLTEQQKHEMFKNTKYLKPSVEEMKELGKFKIVSEDKLNVKVSGIPNTQIVLPKKLISTSSFEYINKVTFTGLEEGEGLVKIAVTTDLKKYYIYDVESSSWIEINLEENTDTLLDKCMSMDDVKKLTNEEWNAIISNELGSGIAFAFILDLMTEVDEAKVDNLTFNVDMKGSWCNTSPGIDYTYSYTNQDTLKVNLLKAGTYKINYTN